MPALGRLHPGAHLGTASRERMLGSMHGHDRARIEDRVSLKRGIPCLEEHVHHQHTCASQAHITRSASRSVQRGAQTLSPQSTHFPNERIPFLWACAHPRHMHSSQACTTQEHASGCQGAYTKEHMPPRQTHPMPRNLRASLVHTRLPGAHIPGACPGVLIS